MDRILITLPDTLQGFLYALPSVQDYQAQLAVGAYQKQRDVDYTVTIRSTHQFKYFAPCLQVVVDNVPFIDYSDNNSLVRGEFDCFIDFDIERAKLLVRPTKRHITDGLGLLIGASPQKWPILAPLQLPVSMYNDILILDTWDGAERFIEFINNNYPEIKCDIFSEIGNDPDLYMSWLYHIASYKLVIGPLSMTTYIAASLKKAVIEIFPDKDSYHLYNNSGVQHYQFIVGDASAEVIFALYEEMLQGAVYV